MTGEVSLAFPVNLSVEGDELHILYASDGPDRSCVQAEVPAYPKYL